MISYNPQAVVFYEDTKLFNLYIDLRTPNIGQDFTVNDTCAPQQVKFLKALLLQMRAVQKATQRLFSAHGFTSLIECDSYIRRFYQYSTGLTATMNCPYAYKKSLVLCKQWALQHCTNISPNERIWLQPPRREKRSPWACSAGLAGIPKFFYEKFGGSCDNNDIAGLSAVLGQFMNNMGVMSNMIRTVHGKTLYLAKFTDKLTSKVAGLSAALRTVDSTFDLWASKLHEFASLEDCHFNVFMEFLSKFSLEVTRSFSTILRLIELNDVLHQASQLHKKELVGFDSLPSFLSTAIKQKLSQISVLQDTANALDAGFPLLLQPLVDYQYHLSKSIGINILFTIPQLTSKSTFCTLEYLLPIKYNLSGVCYQGPITRDQLALLHCAHSTFIVHVNLLQKCYHSDSTFVCPKHMLQLANDTSWLGIPWNSKSKLSFNRFHRKAPDCTNLHDLHHLGGRYYLSTQQGVLTISNSTNGSSHTISLSPLMIYHFPCDVTFATQQTGFGTCPDRITLHVPLFTKQTFHYVPWKNDNNDILDLHYQSLNISPPLQFDNSTLQSLDNTYRLLDGQLVTQLHTLKQDISKLHSVNATHTNDILTYVAFILALINSFVLLMFYCCFSKLGNRQKPPVFQCTFVRSKKSPSNKPQRARRLSDPELKEPPIELSDVQFATSSNQESWNGLFQATTDSSTDPSSFGISEQN
ncbi:uncharacterized protein LOC144637179 [Oculina patagonica]